MGGSLTGSTVNGSLDLLWLLFSLLLFTTPLGLRAKNWSCTRDWWLQHVFRVFRLIIVRKLIAKESERTPRFDYRPTNRLKTISTLTEIHSRLIPRPSVIQSVRSAKVGPESAPVGYHSILHPRTSSCCCGINSGCCCWILLTRSSGCVREQQSKLSLLVKKAINHPDFIVCLAKHRASLCGVRSETNGNCLFLLADAAVRTAVACQEGPRPRPFLTQPATKQRRSSSSRPNF